MKNNDSGYRALHALCLGRAQLRRAFANGAPNLTVDILAIQELLAQREGMPICGKDFKTGQTLLKTILAPGFKARMIGLDGWFSTNILGNRDGEVLDDPESFKTKEESGLGVLDFILQPKLYPELYGHLCHKVRINYYPPRGDNKEGWDNIDIFGWLGYKMQIMDFLAIPSSPRPSSSTWSWGSSTLLQRRHARHTGVAELLLQIADVRRCLPRARPLHPIDEAQEHASLRWAKTWITHLGSEYYDQAGAAVSTAAFDFSQTSILLSSGRGIRSRRVRCLDLALRSADLARLSLNPAPVFFRFDKEKTGWNPNRFWTSPRRTTPKSSICASPICPASAARQLSDRRARGELLQGRLRL